MHWFESKGRALYCEVSGGLWSLCALLVCGHAAPPEPEGVENARRSQPFAESTEWGARLNVRPGASKGGAAKDGADALKGRSSAGKDSAGKKEQSAPLSIPLVQGYDSFGLNLPDYDLQGRLRSLFVIGAISRLDDRNVEIRESFLETYGEDGSPEFSIDLPKAILDRFTRVLVAKTPVTLRKAEFELKGASLEFNTVTKEGGLGGPVKMTIYNDEAGPSAKEKKASFPKSMGASTSAPR
jgi:hypothetical protein